MRGRTPYVLGIIAEREPGGISHDLPVHSATRQPVRAPLAVGPRRAPGLPRAHAPPRDGDQPGVVLDDWGVRRLRVGDGRRERSRGGSRRRRAGESQGAGPLQGWAAGRPEGAGCGGCRRRGAGGVGAARRRRRGHATSALAGAYGVAITMDMVIATILAAIVLPDILKWGWMRTSLLISFFLIIDLTFFGANIIKVFDGGWFPILVGAILILLMTTWKKGRSLLYSKLKKHEQLNLIEKIPMPTA